MFWINFLHLHQPPTQSPEVVRKVTEESYRHILELLEKFHDLKITLNITGSLLEKLEENDLSEIISGYKKFLLENRIEISGTAMNHPILPLIPEKEVKHQIQEHLQKGKEVFGESFSPKGFYLPEMAYSKKVAEIIKSLGFQWVILDKAHFPGKEVDSSVKYEIEDVGLNVLFRNKKLSKGFPPEEIVKNLENLEKENKFIITANDGEMYGHWHKEEQGFYQKAFSENRIKTLTVSEYLEKLKRVEKIEPLEASWETKEEEREKNIPFALWDDPENEIHQKLWQFEKLVYKTLEENRNDPNYSWAKYHYDRGVSSCYWWWASDKRLDAFSPISWGPEEIEKGLGELLRAARSLEKLDKQARLQVEKEAGGIREVIWQRHWSKTS